jgi:hypothetical protein
MKNKFLILALCFWLFSFRLEATQSLHDKYPNRLLSSDYGILVEADMYEPSRTIPPAYNPESSQNYLLWQCFPVKDIKPKYREWKASDPLGFADVIVTMCDFEIWNKAMDPVQYYGGRRAKEVTYCRDFKKAWNKLTKNETYICLYGEAGSFETENVDSKPRKVKNWIWDKVKTKKGCYSYFGETCD